METPVNDHQIDLMLTDLLDIYGYDFTDYSRASLSRRINRLYSIDHFKSFSEFRYQVRSDKTYFNRFIEQITVNVTEMFRDPSFFKALRQEVFPVLATYPFIRIWHAGCSTGEEVYSMAIFLQEAGLLHKSLLYATDINPEVVKKAASGVIPMINMNQNADNYLHAGGMKTLAEYYTTTNDHAIFNVALKNRIVFSTHNLVSESSFNQFQLILCRNVLIYFEITLQAKVLALFHESLDQLGYLALGSKESLKRTSHVSRYKHVSKEKIWRKLN